jgi:2,3-bisphosphoglycerate-dependent phosphoglycerate mutase
MNHVMSTTVYLLRHAESERDPAQKEPEWPLSTQGRQQAQELFDRLSTLGIDAIYSSPYLRAVATVEPFAAESGFSIQIDHDLRERKFFDGITPDF